MIPVGTGPAWRLCRSWTPIDTVGYNAVSRAGEGPIWAVGPQGRIARLSLNELPIRQRKDKP